MTLATETIKLWRNNAGITAGETAEDDPEHIAAKAILALTAELLANREAQPVGFYTTVSGRKGVIWHNGAPEYDTAIYTATPEPAVPEEMTGGIAMSKYKVKKSNYVQWVKGFNACRAAMLAQPVSQRYTLPDGFKLMPLEMTDEIGEAIAMEARCCGGIALCIYEAALEAAPEGGNGA
ncbi:hypothetical protein [Serratia marcescens]|uniref:hypothetical protein n=1 Tax=Serratia marcescens TaxID=615 RepID=UPI0027590359|nr:hypothetical protein [Serratia marcescens]MDP8626941.1 hypothetical protein [Serratia marcescens]MDP8676375.1 hypothetical protein [Serratia marcescens]MDP8691378.1 hypothetical protein [Serratia marcescens]MDP8701035.1 hypothetical protein [Serratia marcescens]MDP8710801.1 hypothetical protein [Serratia marcescens]